MGKFIVCAIFALVVCGIVFHFAPGTANVLFHVGPIAVNGCLLIFLGSVWGGYKLTGK